ncbi:MAG TPA: alanine--tRNA ligase, partial [Syntrophobacteraceae bacterium]|nr:alanine--tRNA ligase [Syntrophobacteraceae bacterium]
GDIGVFQIVQETSVAAGVRRIEAVTGRGALALLQQQQETLRQAAALLKTSLVEVPERVEKLLASQKQLEREFEALKSSLATKKSADMLSDAEEIGGVKVLVTRVEADGPKVLREINDRFKEKLASGVVVLGATHEDKAFLLVGVT